MKKVKKIISNLESWASNNLMLLYLDIYQVKAMLAIP